MTKIRRVPGHQPNAFVLGLLNPCILITDAVAVHFGPRGEAAVIAHEIGHIRRRHNLKSWLSWCFWAGFNPRQYIRLRIRYEIEADAHAASLGFAPDLLRVLAKIGNPRDVEYRLRRRKLKEYIK